MELRRRVDAFLARHTTLTLATAQEGAGPWAAPVFYAHDEHLTCFFLSGATSRHVRDLVRNGVAAVAVYSDSQEWREIQGLQMKVQASPVGEHDYNRAKAVYAGKFPFVADWLLRRGAAPMELAGPLADSVIWQLRPTWVRLIDNSQGFRHKDESELENPFSPG